MKFNFVSINLIFIINVINGEEAQLTRKLKEESANHQNKSKGLRGDSKKGHTKNKLIINDLPHNRKLNDLFEGDIIPDYDMIMTNYGPDMAQELVDEGILDSPTNDGYTLKNIVTNRRWGDRVNDIVEVPYILDNAYSLNLIAKIEEALQELGDRSKVVKFVQRNGQADYISVQKPSGNSCSSFVGKQGGAQRISLAQYCVYNKGIIQHEFMHALGLFHEQARPDRDTYVNIQLENVRDGYSHNFNKKLTSKDLGNAYDYGSVMHYPKNAFSKNGQATITALKPTNGAIMGQRSEADTQDIIDIRLLYQCAGGSRTLSEYNNNRCTADCKCWENEFGCNGDNNACQGSLVCSNNKCVDGNGGGGPSPATGSPTVSPGFTCEDSISGWYDSGGLTYNCAWYAEGVRDRCAEDGDKYRNQGKTANEVCCTCGGGGPRTPSPIVTCEDSPNGWYDSDGPTYNCDWYKEGDRCAEDGDKYRNQGKTANEACCTCGGGMKQNDDNSNESKSLKVAGMCMGLNDREKNNAKALDCSSGNRQKWTYNEETKELVNTYNRLCLDWNELDDNVALKSCDGDTNQKWYFFDERFRIEMMMIRVADQDGKCLTVDQTNNMIVEDCYSASSQSFRFQ